MCFLCWVKTFGICLMYSVEVLFVNVRNESKSAGNRNINRVSRIKQTNNNWPVVKENEWEERIDTRILLMIKIKNEVMLFIFIWLLSILKDKPMNDTVNKGKIWILSLRDWLNTDSCSRIFYYHHSSSFKLSRYFLHVYCRIKLKRTHLWV